MDLKVGSAGTPATYPSPSSNVSASETGFDSQTPKNNDESKTTARDVIEKQVDAFNKILQTNQAHVKFILHDQLNEYYVQIVDNKTDQVIKEIPTKKMMDTVAQMYKLIGLLVDHKL